MAEYIEREKILSKAAPVKGCFSDMISAYDVIMLPAADVAPVRHGRWIVKGYVCGETEYQCSECKETEWRTSASRLKYCPFCGVKMDGGAGNGC